MSKINLLELTSDRVVAALRSGELTAAVFGLGAVGLAVAAVWLRAGARVIGVDVDVGKVEKISSGEVPHPEGVVVETIREAVRSGRFRALTSGEVAVGESNISIVVVPVLYTSTTPDFRALDSAIATIGKNMERGHAVVVETSLPPLTIESRVKPMLEKYSGLTADVDFALIYSPERVLVGRAVEDVETRYPKVVSGIGPRSLALAEALYGSIARAGVVRASSPRVAEFAKLAEGVYRDVNIALANELARLARVLGVDFTEVIEIANTQPYSHIHRPGAGVGGHCIPVYPKFLSWVGRLRGVGLELVEHARLINELQPLDIVRLLLSLLSGRPTSRGRVAVLGLAYRGNVAISTNSPTYRIVEELLHLGFSVVVHDPLVREDRQLSSLGADLVSGIAEAVEGCDAVVVATDHDVYRELTPCDLSKLSKTRGLVIVDGRDVLKLGACCDTTYVGVGRGVKCLGDGRDV
ncbi:MAG: nucleotide sugar dehydrogenase [Sulfolobales archaeon]|nr:nucleotide sugar dehydrogenase [Sulfolobales archaeon]MDW8010264.1 nucleotide sugar dehydrogenase [Sulfolobales archaeon]